MQPYRHVSAMVTEEHSAWVTLMTGLEFGGYAEVPIDAGPHPSVFMGRVDYGAPISRVTWARYELWGNPSPQVRLMPYRHYSAQVRG